MDDFTFHLTRIDFITKSFRSSRRPSGLFSDISSENVQEGRLCSQLCQLMILPHFNHRIRLLNTRQFYCIRVDTAVARHVYAIVSDRTNSSNW
ncbi:MAG: hypothetical protein JWM11_7294 [Planctomycetaceae bacterium]|nr:hypothetical protein [Planctomycetaceae bacterium]